MYLLRLSDLEFFVGPGVVSRLRVLIACLILMSVMVPQTSIQAQESSSKQQPAESKREPLSLIRPHVDILLYMHPAAIEDVHELDLIQELERNLVNTWGDSLDWRFEFLKEVLWPQVPEMRIPLNAPGRPETMGATMIDLQVGYASGRWEISSRRWLALTNEWTTGVNRTVRSGELLPMHLALAIVEAYAAVVQIETVDVDTVDGLLMAGEYNVNDASLPLLKTGDYLEVLLLYYDRDGQLVTRQKLSWTYLQVRQRDRGRVICEIHSAFRNPISRTRRRVEVMAYRVSPQIEETSLHLSRRGSYVRDFQLGRVYLTNWHVTAAAEEDGAEKPVRLQVADRNGDLTLNTAVLTEELGSPFLKLEVMSEDVVVARVPYLLGTQRELTLTVPDDSARVAASIRFEQLKTELLRVTAKRATLIAALKQLIDDPREIDPEQFFSQIEELPSREQFLTQSNLIRVSNETELLELGNRVAANQVRKMAEASEALINRFLDEEPLTELKLALNYGDPPTVQPTPEDPQPAAKPRKGVVIPQFNK
ncbi:hypothetical protein Pan54_38810 [Rubinisphaera italica]|uniref:Uncharacterized protein n=2 Tax=Rubinisphaera italica TaxID=2527969 RepID=A0A5C5XKR3_9PLAN|nr:hypothetical protein Pan54_38810 [Rubinisphaera italica]